MRGEEIGLADLRRRLRGEAARRHEVERLGEPVGQLLVALAGRALGDEALVPAVHAVEIGIAALGESPQQVQGCRRLAEGPHHALRIGRARRGGELHAVDDVAAIGGQRHAVLRLMVGGARLGELAGHAAHLDHRAAGAIGQNHRHLQQHAEGVADVVGMELGEALGAVAALQQESPAARHRGKALLQPPRLAGEDQRRIVAQRRLDLGERRVVGIVRHLPDRPAPPTVGVPSLRHDQPREATQERVLTVRNIRFFPETPGPRQPHPASPPPFPSRDRIVFKFITNPVEGDGRQLPALRASHALARMPLPHPEVSS